ncbi:MAG: biotin-dependent carboxyltransferase family protein [Microbacteriaceae bacterium]|nr:biotin-dependent carboxyltransferase family protein [Microbacteriaceae bacterium]MCL2795677.1 biotin-dependent carboxyltransferase family protein [Microbacteriaceae bacterium]
MSALEVTGVGLLATVQDRGRFGLLDQGVGVSGAADGASAALGNRLVANAPDAAVIEALFGSLAVRARGTVVVAVTGAYCPLTVTARDGRTRGAAMYELITLADGDELRLGAPSTGLRAYLAVRGGADVPAVLGSRSTDTLAGLGPAALGVGDLLPIGDLVDGEPVVDAVAAPWGTGASAPVAVLDALLGPRDDWFAPAAIALLRTREFTVAPASDRVGVRLEGPAPLERSVTRELPSEPVATGSLQVPADGHPLVFLADHPVTGGYPVIAVLTEASIACAAQLAPGARVRFRLR